MSRVDIPEKERRDFYLYIDEFQNFSTESFATILSEARKYHLNLIIAHQYIEQLTDEVKAAVFGNVGTLINFRVGAVDAEELVKELAPTFTEEDILNLPKFEFYVKLMIDGVASTPFSARGLPPLLKEEETHNFEKAIEWTRQTYAKDREIVEKEIMDAHFQKDLPPPPKPGKVVSISSPATAPSFAKVPGSLPSAPRPTFSAPAIPAPRPTQPVAPATPTVTPPAPALAPEEMKLSSLSAKQVFAQEVLGESDDEDNIHKMHDAVCSGCGVSTKVPFKPDPSRPTYCKKCLSDLKKKKKEEADRKKGHPQRPDFSAISPSALASSASVEPAPVSSLSLSSLNPSSLVNFSKNSHNQKDLPQKDERPHPPKERELEEGDDILFE
jgi:CxxC-x17-CxxC domain-containing protein